MRGPSLLAALVALALVAGCTTRQKIAGGGAGLAVVGLGLNFSTEVRAEDEVSTQAKIGIGMVIVGLVTLFVAAALDESESKPPPTEIRVSRGPTEVDRVEQSAAARAQQKRDQAWALTRQAQDAARAGDCAKVTELSAQVGALDAGFYGEVFMTDVAVQRCFVPAEPAPAPAVPAVVPAAEPEPAPAPTPAP